MSAAWWTAWIADLLDAGATSASARLRLAVLEQFTKWAANQGEIEDDPLLGLTGPKGDTPVLGDDELRLLIKACQGPTLRDRQVF